MSYVSPECNVSSALELGYLSDARWVANLGAIRVGFR